MSIPAGSIITVAGLNVVDRLQDAGLQDPKVPTETIREVGNNLVVGKVLTEADFSFNMTSWDTNCDMMALLTGKTGTMVESEGPSHADAEGTQYKWENVGYVNIASPWKTDTGTEGGDIGSGVIVPSYFPTALSYKFGVKANAEQAVTLRGGAYFMNYRGYPIEEIAEGNGATVTFETKEPANVLRIGGHGSTEYQHIFGVTVNGEVMLKGVDYVEEGGANPEAVPAAWVEATVYALDATVSEGGKDYISLKAGNEKNKPSTSPLDWEPVLSGMTKVKIKFATAPPNGSVVRFMYFSPVHHTLPQAVHETTLVSPAAVRGRDIDILIGNPGESVQLHGVQDIALNATYSGEILREMGTYDPIGFATTGTDANGTISLEPQNQEKLYTALSELLGVGISEVMGYINEFPVPLTLVINNPRERGKVLKSIFIEDAIFQAPGTSAKANTTVQSSITWESLEGSFTEIKAALPA
jgi:hypothetical protein